MEDDVLKRSLLIAVVAVVVGGAAAQQSRQLDLRGDRFRPLTWEQLTADQKTMVNDLLAGSRASLGGPFNVMLRSPQTGNLAQKLGEQLRFRSSVPRRLNELAIIMTARWWLSSFEWTAHKAAALQAGVSPSVVDDIQAGRTPTQLTSDEAVVYAFCTELRERKRVSDATFTKAVALLGENGIVDLISVMGYYDIVAMALNVDRYPLPAGTAPPFAEPK
jgi:4-carboxymuconolactone decarboxylase